MSTLTLDDVTSRLRDAGEEVFLYDTDADPLVCGLDDALSDAAGEGGGWVLLPPPIGGRSVVRAFTEELKEQADAQYIELEQVETVDCGTVWAAHVQPSRFLAWDLDEHEDGDDLDEDEDDLAEDIDTGDAAVEIRAEEMEADRDAGVDVAPVWRPDEVRLHRRLDPLLMVELGRKAGKPGEQVLRERGAFVAGRPTDAAYLLFGEDPTNLWDWAEIDTELHGQPQRSYLGPMVDAVRRCAGQRAFQVSLGRTGLERLLLHAVAHRDWDMPAPITVRRLSRGLEVSFPVGSSTRLNTELQRLLTRLHMETRLPPEATRTVDAGRCALRVRHPSSGPRPAPTRSLPPPRPHATSSARTALRRPAGPSVRTTHQATPTRATSAARPTSISLPRPARPRPSDAAPPRPAKPTRRAVTVRAAESGASSTRQPGADPATADAPLRPSSARMSREQRKHALTVWVTANGPCSTKQIQEGLGWTRSTVRAILEAVVDDGRVQRTDANPRAPTQRYIATTAA